MSLSREKQIQKHLNEILRLMTVADLWGGIRESGLLWQSHDKTCINKLSLIIWSHEMKHLTRGTQHTVTTVLAWHERRKDSVQALAPLRTFLCFHLYSHKSLKCTRCEQSSVTRTAECDWLCITVSFKLEQFTVQLCIRGWDVKRSEQWHAFLLCISCLKRESWRSEHPEGNSSGFNFSFVLRVIHGFSIALSQHCQKQKGSKSTQQNHRHLFYTAYSSFSSKPAAYITHNAPRPPTVFAEVLVCNASRS